MSWAYRDGYGIPDVKIPVKNITHFERIVRFKHNMHDFIIEKVPKAMLNEKD